MRLQSIKKLPTGAFAPKFDLVFIDADKGNYISYFNQIMSRSLLSDRGIILVDNGKKHKASFYWSQNALTIRLYQKCCSVVSFQMQWKITLIQKTKI